MTDACIRIGITYQREWQDGFGARGWKLDCAVNDPDVIAATAETGECIPTSVLVHDVLDHHLCGLSLSGHRQEAAALYQLAVRTGSDPEPDYAQMVDEDLMQGRVNGETLLEFLPAWLRRDVPPELSDGRSVIAHLESLLSHSTLRRLLILRFIELGAVQAGQSRQAFENTGLDYSRRGHYGNRLQAALRDADAWVLEKDLARAQGAFFLGPAACGIEITSPGQHRILSAWGRC